MKKGLILVVLVCQAVVSFAAKGFIRGKVTDANDGAPMMYAYVTIVETGQGIATDLDGEYSISIEEGTYTVHLSEIGYAEFNQKVTVTAGESVTLNISLGSGVETLGEATKVVKRATSTDLAVITMKKKDAQVLDMMSSEQMSRQQANNAADAVSKVVGVNVEGGKYVSVRGLGDRYSKTILNGAEIPSLDPERNSVQMDLFPSSAIANMKVYKTFSPSLPGDFSGGLINIETKDFPTKFTLSTKMSYGINTQVFLNDQFLTYEGSSTDWLGFDNGTRAVPDAVDGQEIPYINPASDADNSKLEQQTKSFNNIMYSRRKIGGINQSYSFSIGNQIETKNARQLGYFYGMSYRRSLSHYGANNDGFVGRYNAPGGNNLNPQFLLQDEQSQEDVITGLFLNLNYRLNSKNKIGLNMMQNRSGTKSTRFLQGQWAENSEPNPNDIFTSQTLQYLERRLNTFQLKGDHSTYGRLKIDWLSSFTLSKQDEPDLRFLAYDMQVNESGDTVYNISKNAYALPSRYFRTMDETNWDNKINFRLPYDSLFGDKAELSFGMSYLMKARQFREQRFDYFQTDDFEGDLQDFFSPENMTLTPYNPGNISTYLIGYPGDNAKNSYDGYQSILGSYVQTDFYLIPQRLRFLGGARYEGTNINVQSLKEEETAGELLNHDILPAANLTYILDQDRSQGTMTKLMAGYSKTIARPTFRELAPFPSFFFTGDFVLIGNPELERTVIQNFDLRYEVYPKIGDYFSVSVFYKALTDPIEKTQNPIASNTEITFKNVGDASLYGLELELIKSMEFIDPKSDFFANSKVGMNGSLMRSVVNVDSLEFAVRSEIDPSATKTRPMYAQSPYIFNGYYTYQNDSNGTSFTVSYSVFGKRLALVSQGELPDVYEMPRPQLDVTAFKSIGEKFQVTLSAKNLLNPQTRFVHEFNGEEYTYASFRRGMSFSIGLKYKI